MERPAAFCLTHKLKRTSAVDRHAQSDPGTRDSELKESTISNTEGELLFGKEDKNEWGKVNHIFCWYFYNCVPQSKCLM